jgi:four helix bundle protein
MENKKYDLNDRLIDFAVSGLAISDIVIDTRAGTHLIGQLIRSSTSPALQYGEAQSAESPRDFIHKLRILLKELRETFNVLQIIERAKLCKNYDMLRIVLRECTELIAIFTASIVTAQKRVARKNISPAKI